MNYKTKKLTLTEFKKGIESDQILLFGSYEIDPELWEGIYDYFEGLIKKRHMNSGFAMFDAINSLKDLVNGRAKTYKDLWEFYFVNLRDLPTDFFEDEKSVITNLCEELNSSKKSYINYPYKQLNTVFGGIFDTTLLVIGADTGCGKSELCGEIALNCMKQGKKVAYFDFENDKGDFILRNACREIGIKTGKSFSIMKAKKEGVSDELYKAMAEVGDICDKKLLMFNNKKIPNIYEFNNFLSHIKEWGVDVVFVDHIHYFNFDRPEAQHQQITALMEKLRDLGRSDNIPVIVASHLKQRQGNKSPTNYDLFGSSNIAKIATDVILLSRGTDDTQGDYTNFSITKNRKGSFIGNSRAVFDIVKRQFRFLTAGEQSGF